MGFCWNVSKRKGRAKTGPIEYVDVGPKVPLCQLIEAQFNGRKRLVGLEYTYILIFAGKSIRNHSSPFGKGFKMNMIKTTMQIKKTTYVVLHTLSIFFIVIGKKAMFVK